MGGSSFCWWVQTETKQCSYLWEICKKSHENLQTRTSWTPSSLQVYNISCSNINFSFHFGFQQLLNQHIWGKNPNLARFGIIVLFWPSASLCFARGRWVCLTASFSQPQMSCLNKDLWYLVFLPSFCMWKTFMVQWSFSWWAAAQVLLDMEQQMDDRRWRVNA